ncbi:MAG: hypothetical protein EOQ30_00850 [Mesorhizobium sp.]|nr:hypothetical protein EJ071_17410 [Mesorhizobium sp. M1B.F.Ca.ET.045.04.1.1]RWA59532.1 MAG: hypothetical protein EOQ29_33925 [Mesorhizobium sp.]RWA86833.1 MAG: hypothetical protein EOQ30_00850 [Mesorhizobium sp.]
MRTSAPIDARSTPGRAKGCSGAGRTLPSRTDFEVIHIPCSLERFSVSRKRRTALSLCFYAIPDGKPLRTFLELL